MAEFTSLKIKQLVVEAGFDLVGVCSASPSKTWHAYREWLDLGFAGEMDYLHRHADLRSDPQSLLPGVKSIIAVGLNYYQPVAHVSGQTRVARYARGRDYHKVMRGKLRRLVEVFSISDFRLENEELENQKTQIENRPAFRICVDSAPILEREFAQRAGLGWFGKNTMLIDSKRGSWFLIGLILTTLEIEPDEPAVGGCGTCRACIDACPTGAIVNQNDRWQVDARTCISYLTIEHPAGADGRVGDWTFGCDICQEVCPFNQPRASQPLRAQPTREPAFLAKTALVDVPLSQIVSLSRDEWDLATRGSPIRRAGYEGLQAVTNLNKAHPRS